MQTLGVWRFDSPGGADEARTLEELTKQRLVTVHDAATVRWEVGAKKPRTRQLNAPRRRRRARRRLLGPAVRPDLPRAAPGCRHRRGDGRTLRLAGRRRIDDDFIQRARDQVTPGTSALFVLTSGAVQDKVRDAFAGQRPQLLITNLSDDQERAVREVFAEVA